MLSAEAARLAALEVLCPAAALAASSGYPTLAGDKVFDSRLIGIDDLDPDAKYTPCLALFTVEASTDPRGDAAAFDDTSARSTLEIVAELAVAGTDEDGSRYADAMPADDWDARLVLSALCAQVRRALEYSEAGYLFRRFVRQIGNVSEETFAIPNLGARWHRVTMRFDLSVPADVFVDGAGMPEPLARLAGLLPEGSPAAERLAALGAHFAALARTSLAAVDIADAKSDPAIRASATMESDT